MKFAIYARQSKFKGTGESIEHQVNACQRYIDYHFENATDDDIFIFEDEDFSGKDTKRPSFQRMVEQINNKFFDFVICYQIDRMNRNVNDFSNFLQCLDKNHVKFISVKEQLDTSAPYGRMMLIVIAACAQMERETIAQRVKDNMMFLAKSGRWLGGIAPTGFSAQKDTSLIIDGKLRQVTYLQPNDDIDTVRLIFSKFLELGSSKGVTSYLNEHGFKHHGTIKFHPALIRYILKNPMYCTADSHAFQYFKSHGSDVCFSEKDFYKKLGIIAFNRVHIPINKWIIALGKHTGIVSGKDWINVQNILSKNKPVSRTRKINALISGIIYCPVCGAPMYVYSRAGYRHFFYVCNRKTIEGVKYCNSKNLRGDLMDNFVLDYLINLDIKELKRSLNLRKKSFKLNKIQNQIDDISFSLVDLNDKKRNYLDKILNLKASPNLINEIDNMVKHINSQIFSLKSQKKDLTLQLQIAENEKLDVEQILKNFSFFQKNFASMDFQTKKSLVRLLVNKLIWSDNHWNIILNDG